ncbi:hypothetical protein TNIN_761 [Trichonephila inaurata madagascariensis]|uniref:Uncharacterized protein n=1 Tax=Trichonephila inaurata madagascariensis TaxID=2747483 RepID=A0A8X6YS86_9ARAC|nr:hypothetical protein TNIN_761 [Trichonephila inaurata madagascariensis]
MTNWNVKILASRTDHKGFNKKQLNCRFSQFSSLEWNRHFIQWCPAPLSAATFWLGFSMMIATWMNDESSRFRAGFSTPINFNFPRNISEIGPSFRLRINHPGASEKK